MIRRHIYPGRPFVLFTDLDGTLLDHHHYSAEAAADALSELSENDVPVIFCSSKTFAEQIHLQGQLGILQPLILENGSAIAVPKNYFSVLPSSPTPQVTANQDFDFFVFAHANTNSLNAELERHKHVTGFSKVADTELSKATGLFGPALARARDRWFTETIITPLKPDEIAALKNDLLQKGYILSQGGRFYTVQSSSVNKGAAVRWLMKAFIQNWKTPPIFVAIGDSPNDASMLDAVDFPFLVQQFQGRWADISLSRITKINGIGPEGFSKMVKMLLAK